MLAGRGLQRGISDAARHSEISCTAGYSRAFPALPKGYNFVVGGHPSKRSGSGSSAKGDRGRGRVLALDYGRRRIGLAVSDELGWTAQPLQTIERKGRFEDMRRLREIASREGAERILVGYPLRMDGSAGEMAQEAARFAHRLEQALGLPVVLRDERLTSWTADEWLAEHPRGGRSLTRDELAAAILLTEYLGQREGSG